MNYVVDASVAIKWFVPEVHREEARSLLYAHGGDLEAPDLLLIEVANIAWKKVARQEITADIARAIVGKLFQSITTFHPTEGLIDRALEISLVLNHPVYDCLYLACAEMSGRILITDDKRLQNLVSGNALESHVRGLSGAIFPDPNKDILPPLQISISKIEHVIRLIESLQETRKTVDEAFVERDEDGIRILPFSYEEMEMGIESPANQRFIKFIAGLSENECADLVALMWLGREDDGSDASHWGELHENARSTVSLGGEGGYLWDKVAVLDQHLTKGLAILRQQQGGNQLDDGEEN